MPHKQVVIDANVLISFVTDRDPTQQERAAEIFQRASTLKKEILCPQNVITEFVYVLDRIYGHPRSNICTMIRDLITLPGITCVHELDFLKLVEIWPEPFADFGDAIVASVCASVKGSAVATFDQKFAAELKRCGLPLATV